eukprot:TRINITY_DN738_c1_g1_i3.p1 TRINITY_DN738_c1_g1~~TRINITY_DN738_c1_g1_i3.p1  ORF type:complete len:537 (-),score=68.35 TRINITY_DN738_c1_g1_i3:70-1680(-)
MQQVQQKEERTDEVSKAIRVLTDGKVCPMEVEGNCQNDSIEEGEVEGEGLDKGDKQQAKVFVDPRHFVPERLRVLVVDSSSASRVQTVSILKDCQYQVSSVGNTQDAVELLQKQKGIGSDHINGFDLVMKEHEPPQIKATKLLRLIMHDEVLRFLPVVVTSHQDGREVVARCLHLGAVDYLVKPLRRNELCNIWAKVWLHKVVMSYLNQGQDVPMEYHSVGGFPTKKQFEDVMVESSCERTEVKGRTDDDDPTSKEGSAPTGSNDKNITRCDGTVNVNGNSSSYGNSRTKDGQNGSKGNGGSTTVRPDGPKGFTTIDGGMYHPEIHVREKNYSGTPHSCQKCHYNDGVCVFSSKNHTAPARSCHELSCQALDHNDISDSSRHNRQRAYDSSFHPFSQINYSATLDKQSDDTHQALTGSGTEPKKTRSDAQQQRSQSREASLQDINQLSLGCSLDQILLYLSQLQSSQLSGVLYGMLPQQLLQYPVVNPLTLVNLMNLQQQNAARGNGKTPVQQQLLNQLLMQYLALQQQQQYQAYH